MTSTQKPPEAPPEPRSDDNYADAFIELTRALARFARDPGVGSKTDVDAQGTGVGHSRTPPQITDIKGF